MSQHLSLCRVELVKLLSVHRYSDDSSYSGPLGILGSAGKQKTAEAGAWGVRIVAFSISSHE